MKAEQVSTEQDVQAPALHDRLLKLLNAARQSGHVHGERYGFKLGTRYGMTVGFLLGAFCTLLAGASGRSLGWW